MLSFLVSAAFAATLAASGGNSYIRYGGAWTDSGLDAGSAQYGPAPLALSSDGSNIVYVDSTNTVHFSTDRGSSWSTPAALSGVINSVDAAKFCGTDLFVSSNSQLYKWPSPYTATNPTQITTPSNAEVAAWDCNPSGSKIVVGLGAAATRGMWVSADGGATFTRAGPQDSFYYVAVMVNADGTKAFGRVNTDTYVFPL